jgi:hypothetical protein
MRRADNLLNYEKFEDAIEDYNMAIELCRVYTDTNERVLASCLQSKAHT